jgi:hypothetical protein
MKHFNLLLSAACLAAVAPALAQEPQDPIPKVEVRRQLSLSSACPQAASTLRDALQKAAYEFDRPGEVLVEFTLTDDQLSGLRTTSSDWALRDPVRRAVRRLHCRTPEPVPYKVMFRIVFQFDDDKGNPAAATQAALDFAPAMLRR